MSTPNPLIPQGTFQSQAAKGASNVRIAVATIVAIHLVFFGGLLLQGCKRDAQTASGADTNTTTAAASTNLSLPPIDSNQLYYSSSSNLPSESSNAFGSASRPVTNAGLTGFTQTPAAQTPTQDAWQSSNLGTAARPATTPEQASGNMREYTVVRGDSLGKIAKANGTTVAALKAANPNVDPAKLKIGAKLSVPVAEASAPAGPTAGIQSGDTAAGTAPSGNTYTVKSGDTLTKIAKTHGTTVGQLRAVNNLKTSRVNVGQKLKIPAAGSGGTSTNSAKRAQLKGKAKTSRAVASKGTVPAGA